METQRRTARFRWYTTVSELFQLDCQLARRGIG